MKKKFNIPAESKLSEAVKSFGATEKIVFYSFLLVLVISALSLLYKVSESFMVEVPTRGGSLSEGILGNPRFINPILANGDASYDLSSLIYSGLLKRNPDGKLVPDLIESYEVSNDGLTYTFTLKPNLTFHDGEKLTTDDVIFTIVSAQDPGLKSPRRANWEGVMIEKINESTIKLSLKTAYTPFLENLTVGILPKHIWQNLSIDDFPFSSANTEPVGSGPYKFVSFKRSSSGAPISYELKAFKNYTLGEPYITNLSIKFYNNEDDLLAAFQTKEIDNVGGISPEKAQNLIVSNTRILRTTLPRVFALFFNQNEAPLFANKEVRHALEIATDKDIIVKDILLGFGKTLSGPIPPSLVESTTSEENLMNPFNISKITEAQNLLKNNGWKMSTTSGNFEKKIGKKVVPFAFSISTSDAPELKATAENLRQMWEKIGASVQVKVFEAGDLNQNVIRTRKYEALLFGEIIGPDLDLFAFWHSSQRNDPGLNISLYANIKTDKLLEDARTVSDPVKRQKYIADFTAEIAKDRPAIFLFAPDYIYAIQNNLKGIEIKNVTIPSDRFSNIKDWYLKTSNVWSFFSKQN